MFTHLHTHSYYSFLNGIPSPEELVQAAVKFGMESLALTDHHGLTGAVEFYEACQGAGIKPILGLELTLNHRLGRGNLVLLAVDMDGWASLCRLSSIANSTQYGSPSDGIPFERLDGSTEGLICLTGGKLGLLNHLMDIQQVVNAIRFLDELADIFPDRLYVELQLPESSDRQMVPQLAAAADERSLPVVATHNVYYISREHAALQRTLSAMRLNLKLEAIPVDAPAPSGSHFVSGDEMAARFQDYPEALANIQVIADRCSLTLPLGVPHYPEIQLEPGESPIGKLRTLAEQGAVQRYGTLTRDIQSRLDYELKVIGERGYAPFFLIVQEILDYARQSGVPYSSRGSAASSLVAYCLGITSPDPLALNLYFERFLNPARSTPPDIDTDLCSIRRDSVIRHVYKQYGDEQVAMVATINRFRRRSALREVAKAHGLPPAEIKKMTAHLPSRGWSPRSRRSSRDEHPFQDIASRYPDRKYQDIYRDAAAILSFPRHLSVHPGGVVITPGPMTDLVPTMLANKGIRIAQFDLEIIERLGLVKIDLLGTRGLTVLGNVADRIRSWRSTEYRSGLEVLDAIPEDDPDTVDLVRSTQLIGCFAIESPGMRATLREIDAGSPEDIMIALALYRPGPLTGGLKDAFVQRHLGLEEVEHIHPSLAQLLADTQGVILYQEQVLRIASELAGLSLADADLLRRAMSHFDPGDRMKTLKERFVSGALAVSGVPIETGAKIWDMMAAFAGYGFPKAHAASYARVAWRSAWCKTHYPAEFMAAVLAGWGGYYRQRVYLNEARRMKVPIRPPHINHSDRQFTVTYPDGVPTLYMGLDQVRELTRRTQKRILHGRPFHSLSDLLTRVDPRPGEIESLIKVGGLRGLGTITGLLEKVQTSSWRYRQPPLLEPESGSDQDDWDLAARMAGQEAILGVGVDAHPLELVADSIERWDVVSTQDALTKIDEVVRVAGVKHTTQRFHDRGGNAYYILELLDLEGVLSVRLTPEFYKVHRKRMSSSKPFIVEGSVIQEKFFGEILLMAERILVI